MVSALWTNQAINANTAADPCLDETGVSRSCSAYSRLSQAIDLRVGWYPMRW